MSVFLSSAQREQAVSNLKSDLHNRCNIVYNRLDLMAKIAATISSIVIHTLLGSLILTLITWPIVSNGVYFYLRYSEKYPAKYHAILRALDSEEFKNFANRQRLLLSIQTIEQAYDLYKYR